MNIDNSIDDIEDLRFFFQAGEFPAETAHSAGFNPRITGCIVTLSKLLLNIILEINFQENLAENLPFFND